MIENCFGGIQRNEKYKRDYVKLTVVPMPDLGEAPLKIGLLSTLMTRRCTGIWKIIERKVYTIIITDTSAS